MSVDAGSLYVSAGKRSSEICIYGAARRAEPTFGELLYHVPGQSVGRLGQAADQMAEHVMG